MFESAWETVASRLGHIRAAINIVDNLQYIHLLLRTIRNDKKPTRFGAHTYYIHTHVHISIALHFVD